MLLLLASTASAADSTVQLREQSLVIPTYQVGPAQHNPVFFSGRSYQGAKGPVYPYPLLDKLTDVRVSLRDAAGRELIAYQPRKLPESSMPKPVEPPPPPKSVATNDELCLIGLRLEQFHNPALEPYPYYEEALRRDPGDYRANTALGILCCKRAMYAEAETRLKAAVTRSTKNYTRPKDTEALYCLGIALQAQGKDAEAVDAFNEVRTYSVPGFRPRERSSVARAMAST